MKTAMILIAAGLVALVSAAAPSQAQTKCPIKGGDIDKAVYVDVEGKRVYFCCPGCDEKFLKNAAERIAKMEAEGIQLAPAICPVSGEEAEADLPVTHKGKTYYVCCKKCLKKFKADPDAYVGKKKAHEHDHGNHKH